MKQIILLVILAVSGIAAYSQCDKKNVVNSSKTEYYDANDVLQRSVDETSIVEFDNKEILITPGDNATMRGTITSITCEWKTPYKEGKTVLKAKLEGPNGESMNLTITIEGKDGKISFLATFDEQPDRKIRIVVDKFEEKK